MVTDQGYCGRILHANYSDSLKNQLIAYINCFRSFEQTGNPAIPYISAWSEAEKNFIWYEYLSKRFTLALDCHSDEVAEFFRNNIVEHRIYKYLDYHVKKETVDQQELSGHWDELREKNKRTGFVEAVYKIRRQPHFIWVKDQATIEIYLRDDICLSLGCLTFVTMEMEAEEKLQQIAVLDSLTQIPNRRRFDECLQQEWRRLRREQKALSLIMGDVDYFKLYNDSYGHKAGDACLYAIAQALQASARRPGDVVARYGGEEFAVILPSTDCHQAVHVAEAIRRNVLKLAIAHPQSPISAYVTMSLGIASGFPHQDPLPDGLIEAADKALYKAKQQGRNCVQSA